MRNPSLIGQVISTKRGNRMATQNFSAKGGNSEQEGRLYACHSGRKIFLAIRISKTAPFHDVSLGREAQTGIDYADVAAGAVGSASASVRPLGPEVPFLEKMGEHC